MPTAFVTGCATGFGHALCRRLLAEGWHVVATDPEIAGLESALAPDPAARERLLVLRMDLADPPGIRAAIYEALEWSPVDLLVNNGGYAVFGTQEEADLIAIERMFRVNVLGAMHLTRGLLPTLRARSGTVVQLSSVAGRMAFPESGFYAATKYAIEALSEALFEETCTFGVRVRLIEPGSFDTRFLERAREASEPRHADSPYAHLHAIWNEAKLGVLEPPQDPTLVVNAILASLRDERPFFRTGVGPDAERILGLRDALSPDAWVDLMARRNGVRPGSTDSGQLLAPAEVLGLGLDASSERFAPTLAAYGYGHLDHWTDTEDGQQALDLLASHARGEAPATGPAVAPDVVALARELSDPTRLAAAARAAAEAVARATGKPVPGLEPDAAEDED